MLRPLVSLPIVALLLLAFAPSGVYAQQAGDPVAARALPRGITLAATDIRYDESSAELAGGQRGPVVGPGWVTRRVIAEGEPLREPAVGRPQLVRAGEEVEAIWRSGSIELRIRGRAMGAAAEGERVTVRIDARRRLEGIVTGPGQVRINGETQ